MTIHLRDFRPAEEEFLRDVLDGLSRPQKQIPCKYLYDEAGSHLFDRICELDEYYPTQAELAIMDRHAGEMAACLGRDVLLVELGSGSSLKTRRLLDHLREPAGYVPVDISAEHLQESARELADHYPAMRIEPVCADFTQPFRLPTLAEDATRIILYFPGSTVGNFARSEAVTLLKTMGQMAGAKGGVLIGVDLLKPREVLEAAYNDAEGVTAEFNRNLLGRINRELDADFALSQFRHRAVFNEAEGRVEMHLVSLRGQTVHIAGNAFTFRKGETIHTENSHKYTLAEFRQLAAQADLEVQTVWTEPDQYFSVQYGTVGGSE